MIYRGIGERGLDYVSADMSGRTFVIRQDVETMRSARKRGAIDVAGGQVHEATGDKDLTNPE